MRKEIMTFLLLLAWFCQLSGRYFVIADFLINRTYISQNLCINRDKPSIHCGGKCQLQKKLNEEDKKDQESPERKETKSSEVVVNDGFSGHFSTLAVSTITSRYFHPYSIGSPIDQPSAIFRPPLA